MTEPTNNANRRTAASCETCLVYVSTTFDAHNLCFFKSPPLLTGPQAVCDSHQLRTPENERVCCRCRFAQQSFTTARCCSLVGGPLHCNEVASNDTCDRFEVRT